MKFFSKSRWITVVVDDQFPCVLRDGKWVPVFCRPSDSVQNSDSELGRATRLLCSNGLAELADERGVSQLRRKHLPEARRPQAS